MNIMGLYPIKPRHHDPNVSLVVDGRVVFAYEEEKLSRRQRGYTSSSQPVTSIYSALKKAQLRPEQIDSWALVGLTDNVEDDFITLLRQTELIHFGNDVRINRVPHHMSHAALSVLSSPFDECLFISMDGGGDDGYALLGAFTQSKFCVIHKSTRFHIANFWHDMTHYLGFKEFEEGKLMGLAAYGKPDERLYNLFKSLIYLSPDGLEIVYRRPKRSMLLDMNQVDLDNFRLFKTVYPQFDMSFSPYLRELNKLDIAATIQKLTEDYTLEIVANLIKKTGLKQLAVSGGLFQNVKLNGLINEMAEVETLHVPVATGDAGLSLGAALFTHWQKTGKKCAQYPLSPYLGPIFDNQAIEKEIRNFGLKYRFSEKISHDAADLIAQGKVVGWFQEGGEFGPRALGARSVLADPRNAQAKARVNQLLKKRDWFMPYAPSILEEYKDEFFHNACLAPYMSFAFRVKEEKASLIPAAVHVDGTSRPQTVSRDMNERYYDLIEEFNRITGLPIILNTSFNRHGLPTICTPKQALEHLCLGCVDILAIGDFLVEREFTVKDEAQEIAAESRLAATMKILPIVEFAREGNMGKALELVAKLKLQHIDGIEDILHKFSVESDNDNAFALLEEQLIDAIE